MSGIHAVRVAARIRRQLGTEVEMVHGKYGQFQVFVDGALVSDGGSLAFLGVLPALRKVVDTVRERLTSRGPAA